MRQLSAFILLYLGHWLGRHGMAILAETCYRNGIEKNNPNSAQFWFYLGKSLLERNQEKEALAAFESAIQCDIRHARAWCGLGAAHRCLTNLDAARRAYDEALRIDPNSSQALCNMGELLLVKGETRAALEYFERSLAREPNLREALTNRVAALFELGRYPEAETAALKAIALFPSEAAMQVNYGNVLLHTGKARPAALAFQKALEYDPSSAEAHMNLATLLGESHHLTQAIGFIENEIALKGETAQRLGTLALAQAAKKDYATAMKTCYKALEIQPNHISALITLATCLSVRGQLREAMDLHQQALRINQNMPAIFSNISFDSTYLPELSPTEVFLYHQEWSHRFEAPEIKRRYQHARPSKLDRPLRIGYVSGDFGYHPVRFLLLDVIRHHDRKKFEIHCFSMMRNDDEITVAIREQTFAWHDGLFKKDEDLAKDIHEQGIDILVDLSGHTAYNRLSTFVLKPAPIQATWIGYFHSTGLESIDYFITDPYTSPCDCNQFFSETPVWLPHSRFCYTPPSCTPEVVPPPMLTKGIITFGSFNRVEKLVDPVIMAWAEIIKSVPNSKLLVKAGSLEDKSVREELQRRFAAAGVEIERLELRGPSPHHQMLTEYGEMDIALDTFPFNGGMTTIEALWMGVPVVTIAGQSVVARQTISVLANIGLEELALSNVECFIQGAIDLANNPKRLVFLREQLRLRMVVSPLRQPQQFTRNLEELYQRMWKAWCNGEKLTPYS
ncbi:protein O-GlcNAc transferase [Gammaproteobacteria bacterium]